MSGVAVTGDCCGLGGGTGASSSIVRECAGSVGNRGSMKEVAFLA